MSSAKSPLLLFFASARSGPCRRMESVLAHVARKERRHLTVVPIDVEEHQDVAERFRIRVVPTLVLVRDRRAVARLEGRASAARILGLLNAHGGRSRRLASAA